MLTGDVYVASTICSDISYHVPIFMLLRVKVPNAKRKKATASFQLINNDTVQSFTDDIIKAGWSEAFCETICKRLVKCFYRIVHAPL